GYHGDTSKTFFCGDVSESIKRLVKVTEECLHYGSAVCRDGALYRKIGKRISEHAEKFGYGVVDRFVGHGIGTVFHSEPLIIHHRLLLEELVVFVLSLLFSKEQITSCIYWVIVIMPHWTLETLIDGSLYVLMAHVPAEQKPKGPGDVP
ncbi:hypothetical protein KY285_003599, partial [Solanum tuberosum]